MLNVKSKLPMYRIGRIKMWRIKNEDTSWIQQARQILTNCCLCPIRTVIRHSRCENWISSHLDERNWESKLPTWKYFTYSSEWKKKCNLVQCLFFDFQKITFIQAEKIRRRSKSKMLPFLRQTYESFIYYCNFMLLAVDIVLVDSDIQRWTQAIR